MSDKTDFVRAYEAWKEALRFPDDSPEAFEEVQRLAQVDRRVSFALRNMGLIETEEILEGDWDREVNEWHDSLGTIEPTVQVVTAEEIEDVLKGPGVSLEDMERVAEVGKSLD